MTNRELTQLISLANVEYSGNGNSPSFNNFCDIVAKQATVEQIIIFAQHTPGFNVQKFGQIVRKLGSAKDNFDYASIDKSHSNLYRDVIIASGDIEFNLKAGKLLKDDYHEEYVNKHGTIVLNGTPSQNFKYLLHNKATTLNRQAHLDMIIASKNAYINYLCVKEIADADILAHGQAIIDSKDTVQNLIFAKIPGSNIEEHLAVIYTYGSAYDNMEVLETFKNCHKSKHIERIFSLDDLDIKFKCLHWLKRCKLLENAKKLNSVYDFIEDCKNGIILSNRNKNL